MTVLYHIKVIILAQNLNFKFLIMDPARVWFFKSWFVINWQISSLENFSRYVHCTGYTVHLDPLLLEFEILKDMKRFKSVEFNLKFK